MIIMRNDSQRILQQDRRLQSLRIDNWTVKAYSGMRVERGFPAPGSLSKPGSFMTKSTTMMIHFIMTLSHLWPFLGRVFPFQRPAEIVGLSFRHVSSLSLTRR
ncbi:hypothetical protein DMH88_14400 [Escherichia coli]|nr:hypothetical protein [Escherichia coli]